MADFSLAQGFVWPATAQALDAYHDPELQVVWLRTEEGYDAGQFYAADPVAATEVLIRRGVLIEEIDWQPVAAIPDAAPSPLSDDEEEVPEGVV